MSKNNTKTSAFKKESSEKEKSYTKKKENDS